MDGPVRVVQVQWFSWFGQQGGDAVDPAPPDLLVVVQQPGGSPYGLDVSAHEPLPPAGALGDEAGSFQDGDVLLDRGEAHRVAAGQRGHGLLGVHDPDDDVATRRIGEGREDAVHVRRLKFYNHLVVD